MGPSQAVCHQVQRVRMYKGDHLVFETSQVMDDIPYGDRFKVEARWDVTSAGPDACQVRVCHQYWQLARLLRHLPGVTAP